jgi:C4-type Zn-finger protein
MSGASGFIATIEGLAEAPLEPKSRCGASGFIATIEGLAEAPLERKGRCGASGFIATIEGLRRRRSNAKAVAARAGLSRRHGAPAKAPPAARANSAHPLRRCEH